MLLICGSTRQPPLASIIDSDDNMWHCNAIKLVFWGTLWCQHWQHVPSSNFAFWFCKLSSCREQVAPKAFTSLFDVNYVFICLFTLKAPVFIFLGLMSHVAHDGSCFSVAAHHRSRSPSGTDSYVNNNVSLPSKAASSAPNNRLLLNSGGVHCSLHIEEKQDIRNQCDDFDRP